MFEHLTKWLAAALAAHRSRRQLAELSDYQLADIGVTRAEAAAEIARPFWDFPFDGIRPRRAPRRLARGVARGAL